MCGYEAILRASVTENGEAVQLLICSESLFLIATTFIDFRPQWQRGLRRIPFWIARALRSWIRIPLKTWTYEGISKRFRTESITKYTLTFGITSWEATQRVMAAKLTRLTHIIAIQLNLVAERCTICISLSRWPVRKLLDTPSYVSVFFLLCIALLCR
jgi:hypothetical protein